MAPKAILILPEPFLFLLKISILILPHCAVLGQPVMMMNTHPTTTNYQLITYSTTTTTNVHVQLSNLGMSCACSQTIIKKTETTHLMFEETNRRRHRHHHHHQAPRERVEIEIELQDFEPKAGRGGGGYGAVNGPWTSSGQNDHGLVVQNAVMSARSGIPTRKTKKVHGHVDDGYGEAYLPTNFQYI